MKNILVSDIMTRDIVTITPNTNLLDCVRKMIRKRVAILPIVENKKLKGIISQRDILWVLLKKSKDALSEIKAKDISPRKLITIKATATIEEITSKMRKFKFYRFPVIQNGELVGIVAIKDVLSFDPELYSELRELDILREEEEKLKRLGKAKERIVAREGICEECGNHDQLYKSNGMLVCGSCLSSS